MARIALILLFASACGRDRCLEMDVHVSGASTGQVRVVLESPFDFATKHDPDTGVTETRARAYSSRGTQLVAPVADDAFARAEWCTYQSNTDEYLWRVAAWIEPDGAEELECEERAVCPPAGAPYAETLVTFMHEGLSVATLELDASQPRP